MLTQFHNHLQESDLLPPHSKILIAVSGGVDSAVLLHLLHNLRHQYGWELAVAHYNHGMRSDATKDALLVGELSEDYGYRFYLGKYEYSDYSEAALRKARYGFLENIRKDTGFDYIATGHHNNDFLETAIFNTIRGADREGMVALKSRRGSIIRPLLPFSKPEIIVFANLQALPYREDSTNSDLSYSRNFVRNVLIPQGSIKYRSFWHNMNRRLSALASVNKKINQGLHRVAEGLVDYEDQHSVQLDTKGFTSLPGSIQTNLFVFMVKRITPAHRLSKVSIASALTFINSSKAGSQMSLPGGLQLINTYDKFVITSSSREFKQQPNHSLHVLSSSKPFDNKLFRIAISSKGNKGVKVASQKLYVRYRQAGDRVQPVGMKGTKKLQDVFVDAKVPRHLRELWPVVVTASNQIVWVPNLVKDRRFFGESTSNYQYLNCEVI